MKKIYFLILLSLLLGCSKEKLADRSVVDDNTITQTLTELDTYIEQAFVKPYGISVEYRWDKTKAPNGEHLFPPQTDKVKDVLETIKYLWLETYTLPNMGGNDFFKGKAPVKIYMYGGANLDANGVERISNAEAPAIEMHLYNVNAFQKKDFADVFILMRSVHHQFAKRLLELYPYERDAFSRISQQKYVYSTQNIIKRRDIESNYIRKISDCRGSNLDEFIYIIASDADFANVKRGYFSTGRIIPAIRVDKRFCDIRGDDTVITEGYRAHQNGFLTLHASLSPEDDFAEIISATLTHTKSEIDQALTIAKTPDRDPNPEVQERNNQEAQAAFNAISRKKDMVYDYFKKEIGINLDRMQIISIQRIKSLNNK
ncbi:putative zinc-binding metallopeptidase [Capnocytophaga sp.]|uniref:putative zinc-binding metallopeptidase n=1 Tax=Capnocytophaga sp. TaxID=44737 RepID=UPI0026DCFB5C|nr:putative zinc-binding metallopeptidase [Capnocytophaga sp.]MDO5104713.1 putative zinc-binding metallopeptidase [Capnocytophaga sp.]